MLSGALEASRAWSASLNRIGWGCVSALAMSWGIGLTDSFFAPLQTDSAWNSSLLIYAIVLLLASGLFGSLAIVVGAMTQTDRFDLITRTDIADRVGRLNNSLLTQIYNDATFRYEMAIGCRGAMTFTALSVAIRWFFVGFDAAASGEVSSGPSQITIGIILALFFDYLLRRSATDSFFALERVIGKEPKLPNNLGE